RPQLQPLRPPAAHSLLRLEAWHATARVVVVGSGFHRGTRFCERVSVCFGVAYRNPDHASPSDCTLVGGRRCLRGWSMGPNLRADGLRALLRRAVYLRRPDRAWG